MFGRSIIKQVGFLLLRFSEKFMEHETKYLRPVHSITEVICELRDKIILMEETESFLYHG